MWRFKSFMPKEQVGIEGRTIDIGNVKVYIHHKIAEGGFSFVYLARDVNHPTKQYALKHVICNDVESLDLITKEISVMKLLRGHPNVVSLHAHTILDQGRTKEALLVMECCEKTLVNVMEGRGSGFFEEKQVLLIFRDVCNAVYAMHSQSPPIAHRDLKAENILNGANGMWKLCDFGSVSTNHQRFERPEEMGIEEDNIRKSTTPAYRAPEMWDLFQKELINEKVDIWALGCLLYRISYFKSAFDGESKLQILNGNFRIPNLPKYSSSMTDLIKDMLQASPGSRPDITQVWFRVNDQLPPEMQKSLPDKAEQMQPSTAEIHDAGTPNAPRKSPSMPRRSPPPPPSKEQVRSLSQSFNEGGGGGPLGAFWSTQHADTAHASEESRGRAGFGEDPRGLIASKSGRRSMESRYQIEISRHPREQNSRSGHASSVRKIDYTTSKDNDMGLFPENAGQESGMIKTSQVGKAVTSKNQTNNISIIEFDTSKHNSSSNNNSKSAKEEALEGEVNNLKEQLKQAMLEKTEITSKYEKLCTICRSQRQEIQGLKQAISAKTIPNTDDLKNQTPGSWQSVTPPQRKKIEGTVWELEEGLFAQCTPNPETKSWQAFDEPKPQPFLANATSFSGTNGHQNEWATSFTSRPDSWGFGTESFSVGSVAMGSPISRTPIQGNSSQRFGNTRSVDSKQASQPAGWAGF